MTTHGDEGKIFSCFVLLKSETLPLKLLSLFSSLTPTSFCPDLFLAFSTCFNKKKIESVCVRERE